MVSYDSSEFRQFIASLARDYGVERVLLRPTGVETWEYDGDGNITVANKSWAEIDNRGKRLICSPEKMAEEQVWVCGLYDERGKVVRHEERPFPKVGGTIPEPPERR